MVVKALYYFCFARTFNGVEWFTNLGPTVCFSGHEWRNECPPVLALTVRMDPLSFNPKQYGSCRRASSFQPMKFWQCFVSECWSAQSVWLFGPRRKIKQQKFKQTNKQPNPFLLGHCWNALLFVRKSWMSAYCKKGCLLQEINGRGSNGLWKDCWGNVSMSESPPPIWPGIIKI